MIATLFLLLAAGQDGQVSDAVRQAGTTHMNCAVRSATEARQAGETPEAAVALAEAKCADELDRYVVVQINEMMAGGMAGLDAIHAGDQIRKIQLSQARSMSAAMIQAVDAARTSPATDAPHGEGTVRRTEVTCPLNEGCTSETVYLPADEAPAEAQGLNAPPMSPTASPYPQ